MSRKVPLQFLADERQLTRLRALCERSRINMATYLREGIDLVLDRYAKEPDTEPGVED